MEGREAKRIVAEGYDQIIDRNLKQFGRSTVRAQKLEELIEGLSAGASVLDLGCGTGTPVARELAERGFSVTGVDGSQGQIDRARRDVAKARFIQADMAAVEFSPETFDAVCAFYSLTHVPFEEHAALFKRIASWLRPGGRFVASFGTAKGNWSGEWLGVPMFFSHDDPLRTQQLIVEAGFELDRVEAIEQDNENVSFLWITALRSR